MRLPDNIPTWVFELALVATTVAYGGSYIVLKDAMQAVSPAWLLTIRFAMAAAIMGVIFHRRLAENLDGSHVLAGTIIALPEAVGFLVQNIGLTLTTPGRNAFLTATYCVMVPFLAWVVVRRRPRPNNLVAAAMCLAGVGLLSLKASDGAAGLGAGDLLTLLSALMFGLNMVAVERLGRLHDSVTITFVMFVVSALVSLGAAVALEPVPKSASFTPEFWAQMAYVVLLTTIFGILVQNVAQKRVPSSQVALLLSFESVFATVFSVVFYGEKITLPLLVGFALIFGAVLVSQFATTPRVHSD
ncbi:MAG: DMT family transporter [Olsenella sp.]|nr:DMT family transporter [Olsenella sp.]